MTRKALSIRPVPGSTHVCIRWENGGEVPQCLSGTYTSPNAAMRDISSWEAANREEEVEVVVVKREEYSPSKRGRPIKAIGE